MFQVDFDRYAQNILFIILVILNFKIKFFLPTNWEDYKESLATPVDYRVDLLYKFTTNNEQPSRFCIQVQLKLPNDKNIFLVSVYKKMRQQKGFSMVLKLCLFLAYY